MYLILLFLLLMTFSIIQNGIQSYVWSVVVKMGKLTVVRQFVHKPTVNQERSSKHCLVNVVHNAYLLAVSIVQLLVMCSYVSLTLYVDPCFICNCLPVYTKLFNLLRNYNSKIVTVITSVYLNSAVFWQWRCSFLFFWLSVSFVTVDIFPFVVLSCFSGCLLVSLLLIFSRLLFSLVFLVVY